MATNEERAQKRRFAAEKRLAEAEKQREVEEKQCLEPSTIQEFARLKVQLKTFYDEISVLSKKTPDGPVNKFKLRFLNDTLKKATVLLGEIHRPFPDFETFDEADVPTSSDVVLMLSHYRKSMEHFKADHTFQDEDDDKWYWHTKGDEDLEV